MLNVLLEPNIKISCSNLPYLCLNDIKKITRAARIIKTSALRKFKSITTHQIENIYAEIFGFKNFNELKTHAKPSKNKDSLLTQYIVNYGINDNYASFIQKRRELNRDLCITKAEDIQDAFVLIMKRDCSNNPEYLAELDQIDLFAIYAIFGAYRQGQSSLSFYIHSQDNKLKLTPSYLDMFYSYEFKPYLNEIEQGIDSAGSNEVVIHRKNHHFGFALFDIIYNYRKDEHQKAYAALTLMMNKIHNLAKRNNISGQPIDLEHPYNQFTLKLFATIYHMQLLMPTLKEIDLESHSWTYVDNHTKKLKIKENNDMLNNLNKLVPANSINIKELSFLTAFGYK